MQEAAGEKLRKKNWEEGKKKCKNRLWKSRRFPVVTFKCKGVQISSTLGSKQTCFCRQSVTLISRSFR